MIILDYKAKHNLTKKINNEKVLFKLLKAQKYVTF